MKRLLCSAIAFALVVPSFVEAKSCTDVLNSCMKMYNVTRGKQGASDPVTTCRNDFNGCMSTGIWAGQTTTIKGLEKK
jgi:hypothetical protein